MSDPPDADALLTTCDLAARLCDERGQRDRATNRGARRTARVTINRWILRGVGVAGQRVKLRAVREGGRWLVRWSDFVAFREACTARAVGPGEVVVETPTERQRRKAEGLARVKAMFARSKPATGARKAA